MKKHEIVFWVAKLPVEFIIIFASFFIAREVRLISDLIPKIQLPIKTITTEHLFYFALSGSLLFVLIFALRDLYRIKTSESWIQESGRIIAATSSWFFIYIALVYLSNGYLYTVEIPRLIIFFTLIIGTLFILIERSFIGAIHNAFLKSWKLKKRHLLIFSKSNETELIDDVLSTQVYELVGYANRQLIEDSNLIYCGGKEQVIELIKSGAVDEILVINTDFTAKQMEEIFEFSRIYGVRYYYVAHAFEATNNHTEFGFLGKTPIIEIQSIGLTPWGRVLKRIFDIIGSIIGIILFGPIMLLVGILIKIEDPDGPVIYRNRRVGKNGELFDLYKFRYLQWKYCIKDSYGLNPENDDALKFEKELIKTQSERVGPLYKIKSDPRKTRIGTFIEKFSIDELPQFFNVFIGNMSLVGPRPHQPREVELYKEYQKRVLTIKPGITGMAQIHGREKNDFDREVQLDTFYIENWNSFLDIKILLKTVTSVLARSFH